jgi:hypothetical protein
MKSQQRTERWTNNHEPSTAAITTRSKAVSVAVVMLSTVKVNTFHNQPHALNVYFPLLCIGFLSQFRKPPLEVLASRSWVPRLTIEILTLNKNGHQHNLELGTKNSQGKSFLCWIFEPCSQKDRFCSKTVSGR